MSQSFKGTAEITPSHPDKGHTPDSGHEHRFEWIELIRIAFVGLSALAVWFRAWEQYPNVSVVGIVATLIGGYPIFKEAIESLRERTMTMELSMTIALVGAMAIGEFVTTLVIVFFVLIAENLEHLTVGRGRRAIQQLLAFLPEKALITKGGITEEVAATTLKIGDTIVIKPGSYIPVDGLVLNGNSFVNQSTITGESLPVEKISGSRVFAGTMNASGALEVKATSIGADTAFGKIIETVERAEKLKAPIQKTADRLAGYLVYFALISAAITFLVTHDLRSTISVVIVMGACGVAAGTPLAILGAIGLAARNGAIVKGGIHLEALSVIDTVVLDKTGTLTLGNPEVQNVVASEGSSAEEVLRTAAIAEHFSEHPLAKAILKKAGEFAGSLSTKPDHFEYLPGKGIVCRQGVEEILVGSRALLTERSISSRSLLKGPEHHSEVVVSRAGKLLGAIYAADVLRPEAQTAVTNLKELGLRVVLLTGDNQAIARAVGKQLGVDEVDFELLPEEKLEWIKKELSKGRKVAMLGDGVNDTPALMQATVGIAMGSGTDVARESSDIVLLGNDLLKFVETIRIAKRCRSIILFNFFGTLAVDGLGVGLAAFGFLNPIVAALIHVSSELLFILNSARLLPAVSKSG